MTKLISSRCTYNFVSHSIFPHTAVIPSVLLDVGLHFDTFLLTYLMPEETKIDCSYEEIANCARLLSKGIKIVPSASSRRALSESTL